MSLTIGSLFSGIGGLELGLERAGLGPVIWQAESDPYCRKVLAKHWPGVKVYEDVREVDERAERPGLICGGFPCQDISSAGRKAGIDGARSGLWSEYVRIIRALRPEYVVVENVPALLGRGMGRVLGDLAACRYDAEWQCVPAASAGAPHIRDRVWLLAYPGPERGRDGRTADPRVERPNVLPEGADGQETERREHRELVDLVPGVHPRVAKDWWKSQSRMDRSSDGFSDWMDRMLSLGNAVVPQVAEFIGRRIAASLGVSGKRSE